MLFTFSAFLGGLLNLLLMWRRPAQAIGPLMGIVSMLKFQRHTTGTAG
ncbi:hypothetical protein SAMN04488123_11082 [Natribacillus halophilus]|uniref:Uncharacterized protein n=1 Tax=Natribacillus halophilus TaxID=549003 RepID=A0A1G8Q366_9BACI|nr:hypothetical protein SAMN04488123_11082 [Natribacillus halophilus]